MHVIEFKEDGTAECLYTDAVPLAELGSMRMERASVIEWEAESQMWICRDSDGKELMRDRSRAYCLEWEREYFNLNILRR